MGKYCRDKKHAESEFDVLLGNKREPKGRWEHEAETERVLKIDQGENQPEKKKYNRNWRAKLIERLT